MTEVSFTTYYGDYLLGLWVTWKTTPSSDTGSSNIQFDWVCNLRGRLEIFGYGFTKTDAESATLYYGTDTVDPANDATKIVLDSTTEWNLNGAKLVDWAEGTALKGSGAKGTFIAPVKTNASSGEPVNETRYRINMIWQNPDVQGTVTYDGLEAKIHYKHTGPVDGSYASKTAMAAAPPTLVFNYADNNSIGSYFDIHPATAASGGKGSEDMFLRASDGLGKNDISFVGDAAAA